MYESYLGASPAQRAFRQIAIGLAEYYGYRALQLYFYETEAKLANAYMSLLSLVDLRCSRDDNSREIQHKEEAWHVNIVKH
jgi:hypothetical protein